MNISKDAEQKIAQLQLFEQSVQNLLSQKQNFQSQLLEIESAQGELEKSKTTYKIVGNIMVLTDKEDLTKELKEKREILEIRIKNIEKQETQIREKAKKIQEEVLGSFNKKQQE